MEMFKELSWLFKSSLFVIVYAVIALVVYDIIAEIHIQPPRTLFTSIDRVIPFISVFVVPYVFIFYPFIIFTLGYFAFVKPQKKPIFHSNPNSLCHLLPNLHRFPCNDDKT